MIWNMFDRILVIYIIKLIRKIHYQNSMPYDAKNIYCRLKKLGIKPLPSEQDITNILKLCGPVEDKIY